VDRVVADIQEALRPRQRVSASSSTTSDASGGRERLGASYLGDDGVRLLVVQLLADAVARVLQQKRASAVSSGVAEHAAAASGGGQRAGRRAESVARRTFAQSTLQRKISHDIQPIGGTRDRLLRASAGLASSAIATSTSVLRDIF